MSHSEQQCQNDIVEMIWKSSQRKHFDKEIIQQFEHCYKKTKNPDADFMYALQKKTGVTNKQIQQWFKNKRKRDTNYRRNKKT